MSYLAGILERKRRENARRRRHRALFDPGRLLAERGIDPRRRASALSALRRPQGAHLRIIAEIKMRSPSAGPLRARAPGDPQRIARGYAQAGASAISVLCDGPGFGGSPLDLRRVAAAVDLPLLFKEFVLDPLQLDLAWACGASAALLLVSALDPPSLRALVRGCRERGMLALVEAASEEEVKIAIDSGAEAIGVNARDLHSFELRPELAARALERIPEDRAAVYMSGIRDAADLARVARGRADAALIGSGLMRAADPGERLGEILGEIPSEIPSGLGGESKEISPA